MQRVAESQWPHGGSQGGLGPGFSSGQSGSGGRQVGAGYGSERAASQPPLGASRRPERSRPAECPFSANAGCAGRTATAPQSGSGFQCPRGSRGGLGRAVRVSFPRTGSRAFGSGFGARERARWFGEWLGGQRCLAGTCPSFECRLGRSGSRGTDGHAGFCSLADGLGRYRLAALGRIGRIWRTGGRPTLGQSGRIWRPCSRSSFRWTWRRSRVRKPQWL